MTTLLSIDRGMHGACAGMLYESEITRVNGPNTILHATMYDL